MSSGAVPSAGSSAIRLSRNAEQYLAERQQGYLSRSTREEDYREMVRLDLGENLTDPWDMERLLADADLPAPHHYADPSNASLKRRISGIHDVSPESVLIGWSADDLIQFLPQVCIDPGDSTVIPVPTFFRFEQACRLAGARVIRVGAGELRASGTAPCDIEELCRVIRHEAPRMVWLCNPVNPTGTVYSEDDIRQIIGAAAGRSIVVIDEAFMEYHDPWTRRSSSSLTRTQDGVIVLRTISKAWGLAGIRLGYAIGSPRLISRLGAARDTLEMTSAVSAAVATMVLGDEAFLERTARNTARGLLQLTTGLAGHPDVEVGPPSACNIFVARLRSGDLHSQLLRRGVKTASLDSCAGLEGGRYVRITVGPREANEALLEAVRTI